MADELGRLDHAAGGERGADRARGDRPPLVFERRQDLDRKAEPLAFGRQKTGRAAPVLAVMEIEPDGDALDGQPADQDARDEILGGKRGERLVEREHQGAIEPARREQPQLGRFVGEPEQRAVRAQEPPRMRLERQRDRRAAERFGAAHRGGDHGAMAAVHAVEIADRDDAAC